MRPRFLVVRIEQDGKPHLYDPVLKWVREHYPQLLPMFCIATLSVAVPRLNSFVLHVPWLQDPVQGWSQDAYRLANELAGRCDALRIPVVNRVDRLLNATKSVGARLMAEAGVRTPRVAPISDVDEFKETLLGMPLPLFVREDWGHAGPMLRADTLEEARRLDLDQFERPVAVELIDVAHPHDKLYRKFRYMAAGDIGVSQHLQISAGWVTKGYSRIRSDQTRKEELAYIAAPDPNHHALQRARQALRLDVVAFDYGYDCDGRMIVWEANPYPSIAFSVSTLVYRNHAIHRSMAALLAMYLGMAGSRIPASLNDAVAYDC